LREMCPMQTRIESIVSDDEKSLCLPPSRSPAAKYKAHTSQVTLWFQIEEIP